MTLQQITYFVEICKTKHFTQAAKNLFIAQPALSHAIRELESELGVPLFVRTSNKKIHLTKYSLELLPFCEAALENINAGQKALEKLRNPLSGTVNIIYSYINGFDLVPDLHQYFYMTDCLGEIDINFKVNHLKARIEDELISGNFDLAITCTEQFDGLESVLLANQELVVFVPSSHPLAAQRSVTLNDIKDERLVTYNLNSNLCNHTIKMFAKEGLKPQFTREYSDWSSQISHVAAGDGILISPRLPVDSSLISTLKLESDLNTRPIYLMWPTQGLLPAANHVKECIIDYCKQNLEK